MCGRTVTIDPQGVAEWFAITQAPPEWFTAHFNVAPSQPIGVIRTPHRLELLRWGIVREKGRPPQINTRVESIAKTASRQRRCIVAVDGFYEWKRDGKVSQPFLLRDVGGHPLALAGLWHSATTADGEVVESVSVLTCAPLPPVAAIHDRMPLVIPRDALDRWLRADADVTDLLSPKAANLIATPVSSYVNSPKHDDAKCIEPADPVQGALF